ncbi:hypothetical protein [uncultured Tateyamaria sp.]|uniref:DUF7684 family protein n=1 Tax=uncultured Tateyamaria sp. TaxID=455651 RepID=UPI00262F74C7|nr:hypothetical protein [uncultured Tateyamaria sp.]
MTELHYLHVPTDTPVIFPLELDVFRCLLILDRTVSDEFQWELSKQLVAEGCLYAMAWGENCSSWDDSIDDANILEFVDHQIPAKRYVMTTWHPNETLEEALRYAKYDSTLSYDDRRLEQLLILDFSQRE